MECKKKFILLVFNFNSKKIIQDYTIWTMLKVDPWENNEGKKCPYLNSHFLAFRHHTTLLFLMAAWKLTDHKVLNFISKGIVKDMFRSGLTCSERTWR